VVIDAVRSFAPSFIFTTALPPVVAAGALASVQHLKTSQAERDRHQERTARLKRLLGDAGLPVMPTSRRLVPILIGDAHRRAAGVRRQGPDVEDSPSPRRCRHGALR
jgi:5-aminolevulinate synthase